MLGPGKGLGTLLSWSSGGSFVTEKMETRFKGEGICFWPRELEGWKGRLLLVLELEHEVGALRSW